MQFSTGVLDFLFGKRVIFEWTDSSGKQQKRKVTERWFQAMKQEGQISELPTIQFHMLHPAGDQDITWIIGEDIDQESVDKFRDTEIGDLFAMTCYKEGKPETFLLERSMWESTKKKMEGATSLNG